MNHKLTMTAVLLFTGLLFAQTPANPIQGTDATAEIVRLEKQMWEYWKTQKYDAMKAHMAVDAVFVDTDGFSDRNKVVEDMKNAACQAKSISIQDIKVSMLSPSVALIVYRGNADGTCGDIPMRPSMNSSVWVKRGGTWVTVLHHQNSAEQ